MPDTETPTQDSNTLTLWPLPDIKHVYLLTAGILLGVLLGPAVLGRALPHQYEQWFNPGGDTAQLDQALAEAQAMMEKPESYLLSPELEAEIAQYESLAYDAMDARLETMRSIEVTPQAVQEHEAESTRTILDYRAGVTQRAFDAQLNQKLLYIAGLEKEQVKQQHAHQFKLIGIQMALILALVAFAIAEALLAPAPHATGADDDAAEDSVRGAASGDTSGGVASPRLAHLVTVRYALLAGWLTLVLAQPAALKQVSPIFAGILVAVVLVVGFIPLGKKHASA